MSAPPLGDDFDEVDRFVFMMDLQPPNLPGLEIMFDIAGQTNGRVPCCRVVGEFLPEVVTMRVKPIDMEKITRHKVKNGRRRKLFTQCKCALVHRCRAVGPLTHLIAQAVGYPGNLIQNTGVGRMADRADLQALRLLKALGKDRRSAS